MRFSFRSERLWDAATALAVLAGWGARGFAGWTMRHLPMRDATVPMLMSRHMAEGEPATVFYYGQAYMGSLEAWVASWFVRGLGDSAFAASMGTVFLGGVALLITVGMARRIGGPRAGFFTAVIMWAMSDAALYLSVHPRGGYMVMWVAGLATLGFGVRYLRAVAEDREPVFSWDLVWAGFFGGIGWWNLQLTVVYFVPVVLLALPRLGRVARQRALLPAVGAFLLGGAPWWLWNLSHDWVSLSMGRGIGVVPFAAGVEAFFRRLVDMLGFKGVSPAGFVLRVVVVTAAVGTAAGAGFLAFLRHREPARRPFSGLLPHLLVFPSLLVVFASSHFSQFNTSRYLLPIFPSFAIVAGVGLHVWAGKRRSTWLAACVAALWVMPADVWHLPRWGDGVARREEVWNRAGELAEVLERETGGLILGNYLHDSWMTMATKERLRVVDFPYDVYAPYNREAGRRGIPAVLNGYLNVEGFLLSTGTAYQTLRAGGQSVAWKWERPGGRPEVVEASEAVLLPSGDAVGGTLHDGDLDTAVVIPRGQRASGLRWTFDPPARVSGLVIPHVRARGLGEVSLTGVDAEGVERLLVYRAPVFGFFWSGERLLRDGEGFHRQFRFEAPPGGWARLELRLEDPEEGVPPQREVGEVLWLGEDEGGTSSAGEVALAEVWADFSEGVLLAPRWLRADLRDRVPDSIDLRLPSFWERGVNDLAKTDSTDPRRLPANRPVRLVMETRFLERSLRVMAEQGVGTTVRDRGAGWAVVDVQDPRAEARVEETLPLYWTEQGVFAASGPGFRRAERARDLLARLEQAEDPDRIEVLRDRIGEVYPEWVERGGPPEADIPAAAEFAEGLELLGLSADWHASSRELTLDWHWRVPAGFDLKRWSLFVHFLRDGDLVFQDDHNPGHVVPPEAAEVAPLDRYLTHRRRLRVPEGVAGEVVIRTGWLDPSRGKRIRVRSAFRTRKGTLDLPGLSF